MISLNDYKNKIKSFKEAIEGGWFGPLVLVLAVVAAFGLGRWSKLDELRPPVTIQSQQTESYKVESLKVGETGAVIMQASASPATGEKTVGKLVGSKSGTKYHLPWCVGAQRIKEENKIWFASKEEAAGKGYTAASSCPGL